jgi:branched-chain amino acid aminotransferase
MSKVWIDGRLVEKNDARISVYDHGLLFGDGVAEGMRVYGGRVFRLADHLARLEYSAAFLFLTIPLSRDELAAGIGEILAANGRTEGYVRVMVTRGPGTLGLDPRKCEPSVVILADDMIDYPRELYDGGLDVITTPAVWYVPGVTLLGRPGEVRAKAEALHAGCLDAILFNAVDELLGSTDGSVYFVSHRWLKTHVGTHVAQRVIREEFDLATGVIGGLSAGAYTRADLRKADEAFVVSSAAEVIPVTRIDGQPVGTGTPGPVTRRARELYREAARRAYTEHHESAPDD